MKRFASMLAVFFFSTAPVLSQNATTGDQSLTITPGGFEDRLHVAIAELDVSGSGDNQLQVAYAKTMNYDLEFSDYFVPLANSAQMANQHQKDGQLRAIDYGAWQKLNAEVLIKGEFDDAGTSGTIRFFAHDVFDQVSLLALEYKLNFSDRDKKVREVRRAVHNFVDKLVQKYDPNGLPGCAHSYIAFENRRRRADAAGNQKLVREIFIMDYDGYNVRQITQDRDIAISPAWSPDGRKLVYTSYRQSAADLYIYNLDSGKIRVLAAFPGLNSAAAWSPTGKSLAMTLSRNGNPEIYRLGADGSSPVRLTKTKSVETSPTWTPDGKWIYFLSDRAGAPQIVRMPSGGGRMEPIIRGGQNDDPDVSPSGDALVYTSSMGGGGFNIWVSAMDGTNARNLTGDLRGNAEHPSWAPDGRHIAFQHNNQIKVMDANGSDKRSLTGQNRLPGDNFAPAWGP